MVLYYSNSFKKGIKIVFSNIPYIIENSVFVKPGKGQSFVRTKLRNIFSGKLIDKTFKSTDSFESADINTTKLIYLYRNKDTWFFMDKKNFEHFSVNKIIIGNLNKWIIKQNTYTAHIWKNKIISIHKNNFVNLKVINFVYNIKGNSINSGNKLAELETGVKVKIPLFIEIGDIIKVDTRSEEYISRITKKSD
ncbi:elongation factor P [Buchnera aphidicola (Kurisakia onigurumii)]|uniref:elongation factor P n=1 Tax=Buchnera aphidicola TaxID=9 RepID=UPI0031B70A7A